MKTKFLTVAFSLFFMCVSIVMIKAVKEAKLCDPIWTVTYSGSLGTSTNISVTCTTGGDYKCPFCLL